MVARECITVFSQPLLGIVHHVLAMTTALGKTQPEGLELLLPAWENL